MTTREERARKSAYMRAYYARKKHDAQWIQRERENRRRQYAKQKDEPEFIARRRASVEKWSASRKGAAWRRAYAVRPDVRERQRFLAAERRKDPEFRKRLNAKKREYSKTAKYMERRRVWARKYRRTESGSRAEMRGRLKGYGITLADYGRMLCEQGGVCAICKTLRVSKAHPRLNVDHNHKTGKVRGLLCWMCNRGIGLLGDDLKRLESAVEYLKTRS